MATPLRSMTGYGAARGEAAGLRLGLRLRSWNHRFLDLQLRLPAELEPLAATIEKEIRAAVQRGHVEVSGVFERPPTPRLALNRPLAAAYLAAFRQLRSEHRELAHSEIDAAELLRFPGVLAAGAGEAEEAAGELDALVLSVLAACLADHARMREREAAALAHEMRRRLAAMAAAVRAIAALRESFAAAFAARFRARLAQWTSEALPPERLATEAALLVERSDIAEELARLEAHLAEFARILDQGGEVGKKLDFLLQEINREVNTLLAKTAGLAGEGLGVTTQGLALKSEAEKLREQVQNLE